MSIRKISIAALLAGSVAVSADEPVSVVTPGGTKVQLYGRLELGAAYENDVTGGLWSKNAPDAKINDAQSRTSLSVARTRLGLNLTGPSKEGEPDLTGRFEADFSGTESYSNFSGANGSNSGFRIRQSWGSVKFKDIGLTLLFGMTDDLITPLDPPSINASSFNGAGNLGNRRPQIRVTQAVGPVEIAVAATHDRTYGYTARKDALKSDPATDKAFTDANAPSTPAVQGSLRAKLPASWAGEKANIALGVGGLFAKSEAANDDDTSRFVRPEPTYGFGADLSVPVIDIVTLTGEFFMGQNLSRYGDGSLGQSRAYGKLKSKDGKSEEDFGGVQSFGGWGGVSVKLPANLSLTGSVGGEALDEDSKSVDKIESNMFISAGLGYNFTSAAKLVFEYVNLSTVYAVAKLDKDEKPIVKDNSRPEFGDGYTRSLNRFELNFRYDFK